MVFKLIFHIAIFIWHISYSTTIIIFINCGNYFRIKNTHISEIAINQSNTTHLIIRMFIND